jgi:hypothetical protein
MVIGTLISAGFVLAAAGIGVGYWYYLLRKIEKQERDQKP